MGPKEGAGAQSISRLTPKSLAMPALMSLGPSAPPATLPDVLKVSLPSALAAAMTFCRAGGQSSAWLGRGAAIAKTTMTDHNKALCLAYMAHLPHFAANSNGFAHA